MNRLGEINICTSIIVSSELRFGAIKKGSVKLTQHLEAILSAMEVLPYEDPADSHYALLRNHLETEGKPIGPNDMLIAAHALSLNLILVTANMGEFSRVPGLTVENWI